MRVSWLPMNFGETLQCACSPRSMTRNRLRISNTRSRHFSASPSSRASFAAPEISFGRQREVPQSKRDKGGFEPVGEEEGPKFCARLIPSSPSYFTAQPLFTDDLLVLQNLLRRYSTLPVVKPGEQPRVSWRSLTEYRDQVGETVKSSKYQKIVQILNRLNYIHPSLMPSDVRAAISEYKRDINTFQNIAKVSPVDRLGRTLGAGRRKAATARAWVVEGTGEVLVNGKTLVEAFGRVHDRESVIWALKATNRIDKYNVWALSMGGGTTGQAEALTLAVGKALLAHEPALKPALRRAGCLTRNPKRVERKKPGHVKARKMPAWVKR